MVLTTSTLACCHNRHSQISLTGYAWWRHQMKTFSALLAIRAGNSPVPGEFPAQRSVKRRFDVFFHLRLNKLLSKQSWGWWFETLSRPLWCKIALCLCLYCCIGVTSMMIHSWKKGCPTLKVCHFWHVSHQLLVSGVSQRQICTKLLVSRWIFPTFGFNVY